MVYHRRSGFFSLITPTSLLLSQHITGVLSVIRASGLCQGNLLSLKHFSTCWQITVPVVMSCIVCNAVHAFLTVAQDIKWVIHLSDGGLIPNTSSLHVKVSLGKILNPKLLLTAVLSVCQCVYKFLMNRLAPCREATCHYCINVCLNG